MGYFGHKNSTCSKPWIHSKDFFEILHNEKGEEEYGTYFNGFPEKKKKSQSGQMDYFDLKMTCSHNSGSTLKIFLKFCKMKGVKRYMKISLMFL